MKYHLLKAWVRCRRLFGRAHARDADTQTRESQEIREVAQLLRRANPFASWTERAHWMAAVAAWLRAETPVWSDDQVGLACAHHRTRLMLNWLQAHKETRRLVQAAAQKTLRESIGPELFCGTNLPPRSGVLGTLLRGLGQALIPRALVPGDLSALLLALFPAQVDARWLRDLDAATRGRLWKLIADDDIAHKLHQQVDEALHFLVNAVLATGISPEVRMRLGPRLPLRSTPFMSLRREMEKFLAAPGSDEGAMRSVRMLLAVCQAQTDKVYEHLDEHGVAVSLVLELEDMRLRLTRIARLIDLRSALADDGAGHALQLFLAESVREHHHHAGRAMLGRSFSLLARKAVERHSGEHEFHLADTRDEYRDILRAGAIGGVVAALAVFGVLGIETLRMAGFGELLAYTGLYGLMFAGIALLGGSFAARQSPAVAPMLAARVAHVDSLDGMRAYLRDAGALIRAQVATALGNTAMVVLVTLAAGMLVKTFSGRDLVPMGPGELEASLSIMGRTPLLAILTGLMCWLASLAAGLAGNWFVLHRLRDAIAHHRGLRRWLGAPACIRFAGWCARGFGYAAGAAALAFLFGLLPALGDFFGVALDIRHGTLAAGMLTLALLQSGPQALGQSASWLALAGVLVTFILNLATPFVCSLWLAMDARQVAVRNRRAAWKALGRRLLRAPLSFVLAPPDRAQRAQTRFARPVSRPEPEPDQPSRPPRDRTGTH
jgi:site-specific recombinase